MAPAASRTRLRLQGALCLFLLLALLAPPATAETGRILSSTYRVDFGPLAPGEMGGGSFTLSNPGYAPVRITFLQEGTPILVKLPDAVLVPPGDSVLVSYTYRVPSTMAPGHHGEAARLVVNDPMTATAGVGTLDAGTAILFTSRTTAVGISAIEAPAFVLPGENVTGRVLVVNTWNASANVSARIAWLDPAGRELRAIELPAAAVPPGGTTAFPFTLAANASGGPHRLEAGLRAAAGVAPVSEAKFAKPLDVGRRSATIAIVNSTDAGDGNALVVLALENTGDVPVTIRPRLEFVRPDGNGTYEVLLAPITLQPGERRLVEATAHLPAGRFALRAGDALDGTNVAVDVVEQLDFHMTAPRVRDDVVDPWRYAPFLAALLVLGLASWLVFRERRRFAGGFAWLRRAAEWRPRFTLALRLPRWPRRAAAPAEPDALDLFLASLEPAPAAIAAVPAAAAAPANPPSVAGGALLFDLVSLGDHFDVEGLLRQAEGLTSVKAYLIVPTPLAAGLAHRRLERAGVDARIRIATPAEPANDLRLDIAFDASREAATGSTIYLATHDAAFAPLVRRLAAEGTRVEVVGLAGHLPAALQQAAHAAHELPTPRAPSRALLP